MSLPTDRAGGIELADRVEGRGIIPVTDRDLETETVIRWDRRADLPPNLLRSGQELTNSLLPKLLRRRDRAGLSPPSKLLNRNLVRDRRQADIYPEPRCWARVINPSAVAQQLEANRSGLVQRLRRDLNGMLNSADRV